MPFIYLTGNSMPKSKEYPYGKDSGVRPRKQLLCKISEGITGR